MKFVLPLLLTLAACGHEGKVHLPDDAPEPSAIQVQLHEVVRTRQSAPIRTTGTSRALRDADLAPAAQGRIEAILVTAGEDVRQGDVLVRLDAQAAFLGASQAFASANAAQTQADQLEAEVARLEPLVARGSISQSRIDQLVAQRDAAKAQARAASSAAGAAQTSAKMSTLRAPFDGTVVTVPVEVGELANGTLVRLVDMSAVEVKVALHERDIGRLTLGDAVHVTFPSTGQRADGEVVNIGLEISESTRTAEVIARIPNPDRAYRPGMFAKLEIVPQRTREAIVVPSNAVGGTATSPYVYVVVEGAATRRPVTTFPFDRDQVEVVEGLEDREHIVVGSLTRVAHGSSVRDDGGEAQ